MKNFRVTYLRKEPFNPLYFKSTDESYKFWDYVTDELKSQPEDHIKLVIQYILNIGRENNLRGIMQDIPHEFRFSSKKRSL